MTIQIGIKGYHRSNMTLQKGAATLIMAAILMLAAVLMMLYAANYSRLEQKTSSNQLSNDQAFEAAQAGLDYGIQYLASNYGTITANPSGGFINYGASDSNITNVTLANNSKYSVVYTNPTANNYTIILITATGTNADGTSTRIVRQLVAQTPASLYTITNKGDVNVDGHGGTITGSFAIHSGGNIDSTAAAPGGQIIGNDPTIANMSGDQIFTSVFGVSKATMQSQSTYYANPNSVPWGSLSGNVWINGDVSISGQTTAGSVTNPIILIVTGNFTTAGQTQIYGVVYVMGDTDLKGNPGIDGALIGEGNVILRGNGGVNYNASIINKLLGSNTTLSGFAKVPGSWKDF